ncbi:MAG: 4-hydroxy-tetrahydrodipicolinate synthase [Desulfitobacteriaceae bacterium]|nr:4-hydroxy-tetrahydrodipicolinate synthase [Desulfitobacteriaceae bacterium]MDD4345570.1 4-hydroxy-tetrahydrodipicolinate synthase [Desulfitobacteriaceae bacterium]MDD4401545.1 4-hydroxy-tetrahydrodipicolinate synthase [Desulfitobacteriaceae bacterium]
MGFGRILTAMVTPMKENLEVDYTSARNLAKYLITHGSDGIVVCGTTGESPTLTNEEKLNMFREVRNAVGTSGTVLAGVGSNSTTASVDLAVQAAKTGVDGIMAVVPYYNKPSQEGMYQHFKVIAEAAALPVMLYNVPPRTMANLLPDTVKKLSQIPNIVSIKEAAGSMDQVSELKRILPSDFDIYSGDDSLTLPMLALGCSGVVSVASHIIGDKMKKMIDAWFNGDSNTAGRLHLQLYPFFKGIFITTNPVPIKAVVNMIGLKAGGVRLPLINATEDERKFLGKLLDDIREELLAATTLNNKDLNKI